MNHRRAWLACLVAGALLVFTIGCNAGRAASGDAEDQGPLVRSLRTTPVPRKWAFRLSVPMTDEPCGPVDSLATLRCRSDAPVPLAPALSRVAREVVEGLRDSVDADALHAAALLDLISGDTARKTLQRSISYLEMTTRLAPASTSAFTDLAAAQLAYASSGGGARALLAATEAATRALELDSLAAPALYDRALALDLLGLDIQATKAWRAYLAADPAAPYADEARERLATLASDSARSGPAAIVQQQEVAAEQRLAPDRARTIAWEQLLRDWGEATLAGDSARARKQLSQAREIGAELARRDGEWSTSDAVSAIDKARSSRTATRRLAEAHVLYASALQLSRANEHRRADSTLRAVLAMGPPSPVLIAWASLSHDNSLIYERHPDEAAQAMRRLLAATDASHRPLLAARLYWNAGVLLLRSGRTDAGLASIRCARDLFARIGYRDDVAAVDGIEGEAILQTGQTDAAFPRLHQALLQLRASRTSNWRHNILLVLSRAAERAGLPLAAMAVEDEDAAIAGVGLTAVSVTEARLARARSLWLAGRSSLARAAMADARRALATIPVADARAQLERELASTMAATLVRSHPDSARRMLDSVVAFFAPLHYTGKAISALVARAAAALALNDEAGAETDLARAAALYDSARKDISDPAQRAALVSEARSVYDELVMVRLRTGRTREALAALEEGRLSFSSSRFAARSSRVGPGAAGGTAIDYALVGDTLLAWVVHRRDTALVRSVVDHERLLNTIERASVGLELGTAATVVRPDLERLYDWLVRPVAARLLPGDTTLAIVADGPLLDVPWAALRDRERGQYLVQEHADRLAPTLADAEMPVVEAESEGSSVFVGDPALDWRVFPQLSPLGGADAEARSLSGLYSHSRLLEGRDADSATVVAALRTAELFHFAGHAVFDDAVPEHSFLAVGPHGLSASAISRLDLHRLQLVVLSACETMRSADRASGGFNGLADAFLSAGARGVVGSLWPVDDQATRRFMERFHRAYRGTRDAAMALRSAQVEMIQSGDPPSAWAAFRYVGQ